jgi:hypothetical protein
MTGAGWCVTGAVGIYPALPSSCRVTLPGQLALWQVGKVGRSDPSIARVTIVRHCAYAPVPLRAGLFFPGRPGQRLSDSLAARPFSAATPRLPSRQPTSSPGPLPPSSSRRTPASSPPGPPSPSPPALSCPSAARPRSSLPAETVFLPPPGPPPPMRRVYYGNGSGLLGYPGSANGFLEPLATPCSRSPRRTP